MKKINITATVAIAFLTIAFNHTRAATITATSCSFVDVSNAVASASPGDVVIIPSGTAIWTHTLNFGGIHLQGVGTNNTIIVDEVSADYDPLISLYGVTNALTELSDLQLRGGVTNTGYNSHGVVVANGNSNTTWRIDSLLFTNLYGDNIACSGNAQSVIDHNTFYFLNIAVEGNGYFTDDYFGHNSFATPPTYGLSSSNVLYVENNYFTNSSAQGSAMDGEFGARVVFRYNSVKNADWANHGTETGGDRRSERSFEVYNNTFTYDAEYYPYYCVFNIRGGSGVIFNNIATNYNSLVALRNFRSTDAFSGTYYPYGGANGTNPWDSNSPTLYLSGTHGGTNNSSVLLVTGANWTPNQWIGYTLVNTNSMLFSVVTANTTNTMSFIGNGIVHGTTMTFNSGDEFTLRYVYVALDQPGRGSGDLLADDGYDGNGNEYVINSVFGVPANPRQTLEPIYCWSNTIDGALAEMSSPYPGIQENRDFYNDTPKPDYTPYQYPHPLVTGGEPDITNGIVAWWKFNEGSGTTAFDSSGNGNDGTLSGSTLPQWSDGALSFNGSSSYIVCGTNNVPSQFPTTISYWINFTSGGGGTVIARWDGSTSEWNWIGYDWGVELSDGWGELYLASHGVTINDGAWHLITMTSESAGVQNIYVDGSFVTNGIDQFASSDIRLITPTVYIGAYQSGPWYDPGVGGFFNGLIDDVRIYTNALSDTDISTLYSNGRK